MSSAVDQMKKTLENNKTSEKKSQPPTKHPAKKLTASFKKPQVKQKETVSENTKHTSEVKNLAKFFNKIPGVTAIVVNKGSKAMHDRFAEATERAIERELKSPDVSSVPPWEDLPKKETLVPEKKPEPIKPIEKPVFQRTKPVEEIKKSKYEGQVLGVLGTGFHSVSTTVKR